MSESKTSILGRFTGPALAGILMIYASVGIILYLILNYREFVGPIAEFATNKDVNNMALISVVAVPVGLLVFCLFTFILGYRLIASSGVTTDSVLPNQDRELLAGLIKEANEQGVRLYLDLTNTKGITGNFTKLGISGLPLATIFLTCFFSILGLYDNPNRSTFLDLAKLTLGAFIGSFVQRQAERDRGRGPQVPSGGSGRSGSPQEITGTTPINPQLKDPLFETSVKSDQSANSSADSATKTSPENKDTKNISETSAQPASSIPINAPNKKQSE